MPTRTIPPQPQQASATETPARLRAAIGRIHRRLRPTDAGAAAGLTPTKISVLHLLARRGPLRLNALAEMEGLNPTMVSRVIGELSQAGLVERTSDPDDGRAAQVCASKQGKRLAERMRRERTDVLSVALAELSETERQSLEGALEALEALVERLKERRA